MADFVVLPESVYEAGKAAAKNLRAQRARSLELYGHTGAAIGGAHAPIDEQIRAAVDAAVAELGLKEQQGRVAMDPDTEDGCLVVRLVGPWLPVREDEECSHA